MGRGLDGFFSDTRVALCSFEGPLGGPVSRRFPVALARGKHLFPFRTEKLSPSAPMVLGPKGPGRVGRRRFLDATSRPWAARPRLAVLRCERRGLALSAPARTVGRPAIAGAGESCTPGARGPEPLRDACGGGQLAVGGTRGCRVPEQARCAAQRPPSRPRDRSPSPRRSRPPASAARGPGPARHACGHRMASARRGCPRGLTRTCVRQATVAFGRKPKRSPEQPAARSITAWQSRISANLLHD
jgi:hypothetical protein